jgi:hypothetical protein
MSVTIESALDRSENEEQFGLNLQMATDATTHQGYTTVFGKPEKKKAIKKEEEISDLTLLWMATTGFFSGAWNLFLYVNLWYVIYPSLLFVSVYMSQILLKPDFATLTPLRIFNSLLAGCAGLYYAYQLLITFVCEKSDPAMYHAERPYFLQHITFYSLIIFFVLQTSGLLTPKTFLNTHNQWLFFSGYLMYLVATFYLRYFNQRLIIK